MRVAPLLAALALFAAGCAEPGANGNGGAGGGPSAVGCDAQPAATPDPDWSPERPRVALATSLGDIVIALDEERAPVTVGNFLNLTRDGFYDGVLFHRVVPGFVIQGGDPLTKDEARRNEWGTGDPGYKIPDEFNPSLRHDRAGVLSMANSGPDTGGSQFFITLDATPHLDDRHSVFGEVVDGMDVVNATAASDADGDEAPDAEVRITQASVIEPETYDATHDVGLHAVVPRKTTEAGRDVTFTLVVKNQGNVRDQPRLAFDAPEGWACRADLQPVIPAETGRVVLVTLTPPEDASGDASVTVTATSAWTDAETASATLDVQVGALGDAVENGDAVTANYAGLLPDGRLFDTSMQAVAQDEEQPKFETPGGFQDDGRYGTFDFTVGSGVIPGFTNLALTAKEGETVAGRIPASDAYATGNAYQRPLTGRDLVFELEIVSIN